MALANCLRNERYVALRRRFRPRARQEAVIAAIEQSEKLLEDTTLADVVNRYDRLDRSLADFERRGSRGRGAQGLRVRRQAARKRSNVDRPQMPATRARLEIRSPNARRAGP